MGFTDAKGAELKVEFSDNPNLAWNSGSHVWTEISSELGKLDVSGGDKSAEEFKTFATTEISTSNPGMQNINLTAVFRNAANSFLDFMTDSWDGTEGETFYLRWAYQKGATGAKRNTAKVRLLTNPHTGGDASSSAPVQKNLTLVTDFIHRDTVP
jgi:hypothetical protein